MTSDRAALEDLLSPARAEGFAAYLRALAEQGGAPAWEHATSPEQRGLERWVHAFAPLGRRTLAQVALGAARWAYPSVVSRAGEDAVAFAIAEEAPSMDGESIGMQLRRVEAWIADPGELSIEALENAFDPTRQLVLWDDDLRPPEDAYDISWHWFMEVGQLCVATCLHSMSPPGSGSEYYHWSALQCAARAVVCCCKAMRMEPDGEVDVAALGRAVSALVV